MTMDIARGFYYGKAIQQRRRNRMEKGPVISHIDMMLNHLDEGAIRAVYMVVKELYTLSQSLLNKE